MHVHFTTFGVDSINGWRLQLVLMGSPLFHPNGQCEFIHVRLDLLGYPNDQRHIFCCMEHMYYKKIYIQWCIYCY